MDKIIYWGMINNGINNLSKMPGVINDRES